MHETEQSPESPKRHILLFIGVTIILTLALFAGLHFFQQRSNRAPASGDPQPTVNEPAKPDEKAPQPVREQEKAPQAAKPDNNPTPTAPKPQQIAATGAAESLVVIPAILIIAYVGNEYRRSRAALTRAAMHEVTTL
ncbi:MAG TPA: hypothetical protein VFZ48_04420 [Candidatus Saccharimonadales bacterium]